MDGAPERLWWFEDPRLSSETWGTRRLDSVVVRTREGL